ncbi:dihydrodipicolinate synthase family protein [Lysinibacillus telephonicus]|uniref:Dihydrodipicolinate synthase family protein n=1 Tax=Lysinibacillus telephonicus TaxID=1714840 RepID=A0A431UX03_9BACI|nr:dihydrodipicolinate synthase family protein [Lysinibacillus telephonicus]
MKKKQYLGNLIPHINNRIPVLVGVGNTVLKESIDLAKYAESIGAQGIMAVNPYYWKLSNEQMIEYFSEIANAVSIDTYLYNIPQLTKQEIPLEVITALVESHRNIRGIKETVADFGRIRKVVNVIQERYSGFAVFTAFDEHLVNGYMIGAAGSINGTANFLPEVSVNLLKALQTSDFNTVQKLHRQLSSLMEIYDINTSLFSTFKEGVYYRWFNEQSTGVRKPFSIYEKETRKKVGKIIDSIIEQGVFNE